MFERMSDGGSFATFMDTCSTPNEQLFTRVETHSIIVSMQGRDDKVQEDHTWRIDSGMILAKGSPMMG